MRRVLTALVALGALLAPSAVRAGTVIKPTLVITAEERYDDDQLFRQEGDNPLGAELMTRVTPRGGLHLVQRTLELDAWYAPDLQARHLSGVFRVDHRGGIDLKQRFGPLTAMTLEARVWRVADPTSLPRMGVAKTLSPVLYGNGSMALEHHLSRRVTSNTRYAFEGTKIYEAGTPPGQVHEPSQQLWYRLTKRTSIGAEYRFQYFIYGDQNAMAHSPAAMLQYRLSRYTTLAVTGGAVRYAQRTGGQQGWAPRALLQLDRNIEGFSLGLQAGQDVLGGTGYADAVFAQFAGGYAVYRITEPFRVFANAYGFRNGLAPGTRNDWFGAGGPDVTQGYGVSGGVEWRFNRELMLQGQLDRVSQIGALGPDGNLSRNIAAVRLVVTPW